MVLAKEAGVKSVLLSKLGFGDHQITELIFRAMLVQASMIVLASVVSGRFSDVVQRRKALVVAGASIYASGLWAAAAADTHNVFLIGMALTGIGHGVYFAVDLALVTEVLPDRERHAAKDLGILNIANALPQSVAPLLGWLILTLGGGYTTLFIAAGCLALLGSFAILPLKSVR